MGARVAVHPLDLASDIGVSSGGGARGRMSTELTESDWERAKPVTSTSRRTRAGIGDLRPSASESSWRRPNYRRCREFSHLARPEA